MTAPALGSNALQPLTTPFIPPPGCQDQFITTSLALSWSHSPYTTTTVTVLLSGPADPRFWSCQPTGWNQGTEILQFNPAVCPSGWTAYSLERSYKDYDTPVTVNSKLTTSYDRVQFTTAYCCSSGFVAGGVSRGGFSLEGVSRMACIKTKPQDTDASFTTTSSPASSSSSPSQLTSSTSDSPSPSQSTAHTTQFPNGIRVHEPWHISWRQADISSLTPQPPEMANPPDPGCYSTDYILSSWVPGSTVDPDFYKRECIREEHPNWSGMWFLMIGLPIILITLLSGCIWFKCRRHKQRKKERREKELRNLRPGAVPCGNPNCKQVGGHIHPGNGGLELIEVEAVRRDHESEELPRYPGS